MLFPFVFRLVMLMTIATLVVGNWRGENVIATYLSLRESRNKLQRAVDKVESEANDLELEILKINSSKSYADKVLKDKYHVTGEGERIIFFAD